MSGFEIGLAMFSGVIALLVMRVPVGVSMLLAGSLGYAAITGWTPMLNTLKTMVFSEFSSYTLAVIPLFLLMGEFATKGRLNVALFSAARAFVGHRPGGISMATIGGCAAFGAICGSSIATVATMTQVAAPEMRARGYSSTLTTGTIAAGGTLGILIPPSIILVIYAIYTEQSIGALFMAAIVPGILAVLGYLLVIAVYVRIWPASAPRAERFGWAQRLMALRNIWPIVVIFVLVIGGIYNGWFSPTEAAGIGAFLVGILAVITGGMRWTGFRDSILGTAVTTAFIFFILLGAKVFSAALALSRMPVELSEQLAALSLPPLIVIALILLIYLVMGTIMDALSVVLLTLPVFIPLILSLDLGLSDTETMIWFGVLILIAVEVGMISPPFGLNLFVISSMLKDVPMSKIYLGVAGFCVSDMVRLVMLVLFPQITLWMTRLG